jgi:hypothetical protein
MPYIDGNQRALIETPLSMVIAHITIQEKEKDRVGMVNYTISAMMNEILKTDGISYHTINGLIGVLECAKLELYRRVASPYEDEKIQSNGDVY